MEYRSVADLTNDLLMNAYKLPSDLDMIVGIPRSGLLAANILALQLNLPLLDLDAFLEGRIPRVGRTVRSTMKWDGGTTATKVLIVDDSILTGKSLVAVRDEVAARRPDAEVIYCAVYGSKPHHPEVDLCLATVNHPRVFQWNLMRHNVLDDACFDIDGVLCHDPTKDQNDDGPLYTEFLTSARPLLLPGVRIRHLVTSRLERYRTETEAWLRAHNIDYERLWMLDLPSAEERRRKGAHASHKASIYKETGASLFVESEDAQAQEIASLSQRPVLSIEGQRIVWPDDEASARRRHVAQVRKRRRKGGWLRSTARSLIKAVIGERGIRGIRAAIKG